MTPQGMARHALLIWVVLLLAAGGALLLAGQVALAIPCPDATFARVVAVFPASYISDPRTLAEVRRVLQADGRLVILLSAGKHNVRMHPLWDALTKAGWQLETPDCTVTGTTIHLIMGTPHVTHV